jgi:hypothetical protein
MTTDRRLVRTGPYAKRIRTYLGGQLIARSRPSAPARSGPRTPTGPRSWASTTYWND